MVDGQVYQVPFCNRRTFCRCGCQLAAKMIKRSGGFKTTIHNRQNDWTSCPYHVPDIKNAINNIQEKKQKLLELVNQAHPSIVKRGGGSTPFACGIPKW